MGGIALTCICISFVQSLEQMNTHMNTHIYIMYVLYILCVCIKRQSPLIASPLTVVMPITEKSNYPVFRTLFSQPHNLIFRGSDSPAENTASCESCVSEITRLWTRMPQVSLLSPDPSLELPSSINLSRYRRSKTNYYCTSTITYVFTWDKKTADRWLRFWHSAETKQLVVLTWPDSIGGGIYYTSTLNPQLL